MKNERSDRKDQTMKLSRQVKPKPKYSVKRSKKTTHVKRNSGSAIYLPRFLRNKRTPMFIFILLFAAIGSYLLLTSRAYVVPNQEKAIEDANWMMGASIPDGPMAGAFATYWDKQHIQPYQANLGALGLARATQISGNTAYVNAVWKHLNWYSAHMDTNGYVRDYDLINNVWTAASNSVQPNKPYDSTDSYAATFLLATRAAYRVDSDMSKLESLRPAISKAVGAIRSTQQADGLTFATPDFYRVKLLEDNVETYHGLKAAVTLANILNDTTLANNAQSYATSMATGIESLWSPTNNYYYWAKHEDGALQTTDWSVLSPDAMEQAWTAAFNISTGSRATSLLSQLDAKQPNWDKPGLNGNNYDVTLMGWAYWFNGQPERAQQIANNLRSAAVANNRLWPFNFMTAGELIILETEGENLVFDLSSPPTTPPPISDTIAPTANITSPTNGATIGNKVSIQATAKDNLKVTKLEIYIDGQLTNSNTGSTSIAYSWNTRKLARGAHVINVKAYDAAGNIGQNSITIYK